MATNVSLTPELESFARSCVESGRFNSVSEVVRQALRRLKEDEERRTKFDAMLDAVKEEAQREGTYTADQVLEEMDEIIDRVSK
ncbi:putative transcriptional regulator, CopG/Arc/MetJ family [Magnetococcus marinus MC-1]|uniref:Putative transcriptional regulator, CopG/Arc/MetJ family n=1 Tax=Magnetococcus marinus (strain ATCC BAA-1437 / JCM 17883 / MC-1) TaxID=156889 RepID=A0L783_MAGMM|nr:type II toxin-antitoxin system ParD family antitoxin [Magnetococcus marinus]ABK43826.1 putative transcriptional regulator, CopG/Arc/MetJ family [Magnetococcus marinus MC-1]ABK44559.1 putative transcriptional regulator, CopG/Arc/MetJ family [Magnetococcus marinus MC-1]ABK45249.1 putative transcriptional regulator, CopG/Arc/MetJ family [Magnetococcus marinus MC-1]ABK45321.1 putative transcriptional regulator, CopG/Arc/MetJ family [Magnetococcus marinus MC-1]